MKTLVDVDGIHTQVVDVLAEAHREYLETRLLADGALEELRRLGDAHVLQTRVVDAQDVVPNVQRAAPATCTT